MVWNMENDKVDGHMQKYTKMQQGSGASVKDVLVIGDLMRGTVTVEDLEELSTRSRVDSCRQYSLSEVEVGPPTIKEHSI